MNLGNNAEIFVAGTVAFFVVILIVVLNDYLIRRSVQRAEKRNQSHRFRYRQNNTRWKLVLVLISTMPIFLYFLVFSDAFNKALPSVYLVFRIFFVGVLVYVGLRFAFTYWKSRHCRHALHLAQQGDTAGAIEMLRERLRLDGPSANELISLTAIYGLQLDWNRAWETLCEADLCEPNNPFVQLNKGAVLWKLGHPEQAVECLRQSQSFAPKDLTVACACGMSLVEMGRIDEATRMREIAERIFKDQEFEGIAGIFTRRLEQQFLQPLRQKLAGASQAATQRGRG